MKNRLSALLDGEQTTSDLDRVCAALSDPELRQDWADFALIGAALRGEGRLDFDISAKVMAALADEPTVLAPRPLLSTASSSAHIRWLSAFAAGLAGVSLVAWVTITLPSTEPDVQVAVVTEPVPSAVVPAGSIHNKAQPEMQDYLVAHQAHASGGAFSGGTRNVRAVSVSASRGGQ